MASLAGATLMCCEGCEPKTPDSTATEADGESVVPISRRGASSSARSKRARDVDGETALQEACQSLGRPALFEEADAKEILDLADSRHRKRGEKTRTRSGWTAAGSRWSKPARPHCFRRGQSWPQQSIESRKASRWTRVPPGIRTGLTDTPLLPWTSASAATIARQSARLMTLAVRQVRGCADRDRRANQPRFRGRCTRRVS